MGASSAPRARPWEAASCVAQARNRRARLPIRLGPMHGRRAWHAVITPAVTAFRLPRGVWAPAARRARGRGRLRAASSWRASAATLPMRTGLTRDRPAWRAVLSQYRDSKLFTRGFVGASSAPRVRPREAVSCLSLARRRGRAADAHGPACLLAASA